MTKRLDTIASISYIGGKEMPTEVHHPNRHGFLLNGPAVETLPIFCTLQRNG
jgi:hypothetical protein